MIPFLFICNLEEFCDGSIIRSEVKIQLLSNHVKKMVCVYHVCRVFKSLRSICGTQIGEFSIPLISQFIVECWNTLISLPESLLKIVLLELEVS